MTCTDRLPKTGLWLSCGGLAVLAAHHWLTVYQPSLSIDNLMLLVGGLAGYLVTAAGVLLCVVHFGRNRSDHANREAPGNMAAHAGHTASHINADFAEAHHQPTQPGDAARRMAASFLAWSEQTLPDTHPWSSFDQLVRETLTEQFGAVRVRCYHVLPGDQQLRSLSQVGTSGGAKCARSGILGHVATTGREFVANDASHGELVDQLAEAGEDAWEWVYPVREAGQPVGLVAVGKLAATSPLTEPERQQLSSLITLLWKYVARLEELQIADRTDKASGLLTRGDFFVSATRALADSYVENEPVVVVVLRVEGLRRLDDGGRWRDRDVLVENIGRLIKRRMRTDDVIGRFSDDRFVLLLRRLDSSLGRLIAAKIQATAQEEAAQCDEAGAVLCVRVGLTGSGFRQESLDKLLVSAFDAVERARKRQVALYCDLPAAKPEQVAPAQDEVEPRSQPEGITS
jgi:GGDEF domain-containing protein